MTDFDFDKIIPACREFGVNIDETAKKRLAVFGDLLIKQNKFLNLTAITEPDEIVIKHFLDCILFFKNIKPEKGAEIIDVGTGAGFPGMVLKIIRPDINITLLDAQEKRLNFLRSVLSETGLNAAVIHKRAEETGQDTLLRERFDYATARAVAPLPVLCELCIPLVKVGGYFVAMKGSSAKEEVAAATNAYKILCCEKPIIYNETLDGNIDRAFVVSKKISQCSTKYPRSFAKIKKNAL